MPTTKVRPLVAEPEEKIEVNDTLPAKATSSAKPKKTKPAKPRKKLPDLSAREAVIEIIPAVLDKQSAVASTTQLIEAAMSVTARKLTKASFYMALTQAVEKGFIQRIDQGLYALPSQEEAPIENEIQVETPLEMEPVLEISAEDDEEVIDTDLIEVIEELDVAFNHLADTIKDLETNKSRVWYCFFQISKGFEDLKDALTYDRSALADGF